MDAFVITCLVIAGVVVSFALMKHPRAAIVLWLIVMIAVPSWISVKVVTSLSPLNFTFLLLVPAILHAANQRLSKVDLLLGGFVVSVSVAFAFLSTPQYAFATVFVQWLAGYWVGRYLAPAAGKEWVYRAVAIAATVVGIWAIAEFAFSLHLFENFAGTDASAGWQKIQIRGAFARSEGAWGHSIAMGAFLALGLPFVIASKFAPVRKTLMIAAVCGGVIVTFSRGALIGALIVFVACVIFLPGTSLGRKTRQFFFALLVLVAVTLVPYLLSVFDSLSYDLDPSTQYRADLTKYIFEDMHALGPADQMNLLPNGRYFYRMIFGSIDNTYVLTILQFGWVPTALLGAGLVAVIFRVLIRRGGPADIAMFGQIWVMGTVALITQYGMAVWFCAGMAVAFGIRDNARSGRTPLPPELAHKHPSGSAHHHVAEPITK
ncbi:hypothetical protein AB0N24_22675 [Arthrobacter sp. NPDC093128]|uniref:hypothetical protein n=1 Tax=Arthrobacter sp. NPDC093128 TaxID=3154979 RepID=UPI0034247CED